MYNGNNMQPPKLTDPAELAPVVRAGPDSGGEHPAPSGGRGASHGGAG